MNKPRPEEHQRGTLRVRFRLESMTMDKICSRIVYRGTALIRNRLPLGSYGRTYLEPCGGPRGGGLVSYERGTPADGSFPEVGGGC